MKHLLLLLITLGASVASARDVALKCETSRSCVAYYTTGSAQCDSGFKRTSLKAKGSTTGSYCERKCDAGERKTCNAKRCEINKSECSRFPYSSVCSDALAWCDPEPIKTTKENCVRIRMGRAVKFNETDGTCAYDPNPPKDDHYLSITVRKSRTSATLYMTCDPVTAAGARSVVAAVIKVSGRCDMPATVLYEVKTECREGPDKFEALKAAAGEACAVAAHPGTGNTTFEAVRG
jgi:hypothetical protein